jgi:hypothetical protein
MEINKRKKKLVNYESRANDNEWKKNIGLIECIKKELNYIIRN